MQKRLSASSCILYLSIFVHFYWKKIPGRTFHHGSSERKIHLFAVHALPSGKPSPTISYRETYWMLPSAHVCNPTLLHLIKWKVLFLLHSCHTFLAIQQQQQQKIQFRAITWLHSYFIQDWHALLTSNKLSPKTNRPKPHEAAQNKETTAKGGNT